MAQSLIGHKQKQLTAAASQVTLTPEQVKPLKAIMMDKNFFENKLKKTLAHANPDLFRSRVGKSVTEKFVRSMDKEKCEDETRLKVKFDPFFRHYLADNPVRPRSAVNFQIIQTGLNMRKKMPLFKTPPELNLIQSRLQKIKKNQKKIISDAFNQFKNEPGSCFTREAIG